MAGDLYVGMVVGGFIAAFWSFLMARYVAGPRAKTLMVGTLRGDTAADKQIVSEIREQLIRPEITEGLKAVPMPEFDLSPVMDALDGRLTKLETEMPDLIGSHIEMHIKSAKAVEAKQIGKALEDMGINFEGAANEAMQFAEAQLPPEMIAMKKLLTTKIPKAVREDNPGWAWILENARQIGGGMLMSRLQQRAGVGGVAVEAVETSWTPGARR